MKTKKKQHQNKTKQKITLRISRDKSSNEEKIK